MTFLERLKKNLGPRMVYGVLALLTLGIVIAMAKIIPLIFAVVLVIFLLGWAIDDLEDWWIERKKRKEKS